MPATNPFPLTISTKQDSYERTLLLANVPEEYKWIAAEFNIIIQALTFLYENQGGSVPSTTPGYNYLFFGASLLMTSAGDSTTGPEIVELINNLGFTITAGRLSVIVVDVKRVKNGRIVAQRESYKFKQNNVEGTWGTGSTNGEVSITQLIIEETQELFELEADVEIINLGDISSGPIEDYLNTFVGTLPDRVNNTLADDGTTYYFTCLLNDDFQTYKYVGTLPVTLGDGNDTVATEDFDLVASSEDPEPEVIIPKEETITGTRVTESVATTYAIDLNAGSVFELTMTADTTFTLSNLPTGTNVKAFTVILTGEYVPTLPAYCELTPSSDDFDGTVRNRLIFDVINGSASSEDVIVTQENLAS